MIESFEKKPANGGMPTSASEPIRKTIFVCGISLPMPASLRMSCSPVSAWIAMPGGEEEQRLEERVRHQVEHRARVRAEARADEHVADLRHRRVGDHALDVGLDERDQPGHQERRGAEPGGEILDHVRVLEQRMAAHDQVDAGGDHRRRVDEGADRRRAFHRVRKPGVERDLRRLRDGAAEQAERDQVRDRAAVRRGGEHAGVVELPGVLDQQEERERHRRVAERVHHERLLRRRDRRRPLLVEADQQVAREADHAPAGEQEQQVAALDEQQHREDEQRHVGEVAALLVLAVHVADRVGDDQRADAGDDQHHHDRELVDEQREAEVVRAGREPRPRGRRAGARARALAPHLDERDDRGREGAHRRQRREVRGAAARDARRRRA